MTKGIYLGDGVRLYNDHRWEDQLVLKCEGKEIFLEPGVQVVLYEALHVHLLSLKQKGVIID